MTPEKIILEWKSKIQYRKGTPSISLIKYLSNSQSWHQGKEKICRLVLIEGKLHIMIEVE